MTDRKARLAALAAKAGRNQKPSQSSSSLDSDKPNEIERKRRRVEDDDKQLSVGTTEIETNQETEVLGSTDLKDSENKNNDALEKALREAEEREARERAIRQQKEPSTGLGLVDLAPKKVNWDLRRDCAKKLEKLERRTQIAIVKILKDRLEKEAEEEDLD